MLCGAMQRVQQVCNIHSQRLHFTKLNCFIGNDKVELHSHLSEAMRQTRVGAIIDAYSGTNRDAFGHYYLHDFVRMVHRSKHKKRDMEDLEYEVLQQQQQQKSFFHEVIFIWLILAHCQLS